MNFTSRISVVSCDIDRSNDQSDGMQLVTEYTYVHFIVLSSVQLHPVEISKLLRKNVSITDRFSCWLAVRVMAVTGSPLREISNVKPSSNVSKHYEHFL